MSDLQMHPFYRIWLTWVDPIVIGGTITGVLIDPNLFMDGFIPASISQANPDHAFLYHHLAVFYGFIAIMVGVLQRVSSDLRVWKTIQAAVLYVDVALIAIVYTSLKQQGRLSLDQMRPVDWANFLFTGWVALIRVFFLAGVGVGKVEEGKKRQ